MTPTKAIPTPTRTFMVPLHPAESECYPDSGDPNSANGDASGEETKERRTESPPRRWGSKVRVHVRGKRVLFVIAGVVIVVVIAAFFVFAPSGPSGPSPRFRALMAEDAGTGQFLLVGGVANGSDDNTLSDMWAWSGRAWTELPQQTPPDNTTFFASMVYDNETREPLLVEQGPPGHTWVWDGHSWQSAGTLSPTSTLIPALAYDKSTKQLIAVIAADGGAVTSLWNGRHWIEVHDAGSLPPVGGDMAYDQETDQLLLIS